MTRRQLLVISDHAAEYSKLLQAADLPDLSIDCASSTELALPYCESAEIIFGAPDHIAPLLNKCPKLKWVQSSWAGVTPFIDHPRQDYLLTGVKGIFGQVMAEYTLTWLLYSERQVRRHISAKHWDDRTDGSLFGKAIGIMGTGSIGIEVARYLKIFGMHIRGLNSDGRTIEYFDQCYSFENRLEFAQGLDYVLALLPDTPATNNAVDSLLLEELNPGAVLINAGRGNSVCIENVIAALQSGDLAHAVLDVLEEEPLADIDPLWEIENLTVTSHTAAPSMDEPIVGVFCDNYHRYHRGEDLQHLIDFEKGY
jgi:phosphoglycerate dehydrogenase-like enzyme